MLFTTEGRCDEPLKSEKLWINSSGENVFSMLTIVFDSISTCLCIDSEGIKALEYQLLINYTIMKKIKVYKQRKMELPLTSDELNEWSKCGWDLVAFDVVPNTGLIVSNELWFYYIFAREVEAEKKEKPIKVIEDTSEFVERIYKMYPSTCPMRGASLGKCKKDKERIKKLLKEYTEEQIEYIVKKEVEDKYGKNYMQNFSTFLNNFPDPSYIEVPVSTPKESKGEVIINGTKYR